MGFIKHNTCNIIKFETNFYCYFQSIYSAFTFSRFYLLPREIDKLRWLILGITNDIIRT